MRGPQFGPAHPGVNPHHPARSQHSNFSLLDRQLNTRRGNVSKGRMYIAMQNIYHDAQHPSGIILPVVE
jgi:hypothetical protein